METACSMPVAEEHFQFSGLNFHQFFGNLGNIDGNVKPVFFSGRQLKTGQLPGEGDFPHSGIQTVGSPSLQACVKKEIRRTIVNHIRKFDHISADIFQTDPYSPSQQVRSIRNE